MEIETIYYRGLLKSCNYECSYCPFRARLSKRELATELSNDKAALIKFCDKVLTNELCHKDGITVMFVPSGEALIHGYYHDAIATLCENNKVQTVCCQTNLSFNIEQFAKKIPIAHRHKISLWCTFHTSQVELRDFLKQCEVLQKHEFPFCVGAVGRKADISALQKLREALPSDIYMWLNALKGGKYNQEEINAFCEIDPLFPLELQNFPANPEHCHAGRKSIFVDSNGDFFACNISKVKLGNIYSTNAQYTTTKNICRAKKCNCYLAYSNRTNF